MAASLGVRIFARVPYIFAKFSRKITKQAQNEAKVLLTGCKVCQNHSRHFSKTQSVSSNSQELPATEVKKLMERLTDKFSEARELMDDAVKIQQLC